LANELWTSYVDGNTLYALVWSKSGDTVWNVTTEAFVAYAKASIGDYDIAMANVATLSDYYTADFPVAITGTDPTSYRVQIMLQTTGAPDADLDFALAQGEIVWDGTSEITLGTVTITNQTVTNVYGDDAPSTTLTVINL
jgi:hypothetical protein